MYGFRNALRVMVVFSVFWLSGVNGAQAELVEIDFEAVDLQGGGEIPNPYVLGNYDGYYFGNLGVYDRSIAEQDLGYSGYSNGATSGEQAAYQLWSMPSYITRSTDRFDLFGGFFTAGWREDVQLRVRGFRNYDNIAVYDEVFTIGTEALYLELDVLDVYAVTFETYGGVSAGFEYDGTNFIVDDLELFSIPAPAGAFLITGGFFLRRRRA
ncbi:MAG: hypothetical protein CBC35_09900 [Planctomycetes bacterium TMED75]|nr:hypothetical protein [Planctomycetaceae bacterium]OUU91273.1 MAG: hypothetical protein CBC35_09900 [Planctomycetes bacterium TMED75]